ncbi:MAG: AAA family ATPase [Syntrophales bacterium]|nr:AAA family ATPase [Syntrophales bacterium]MCK9390289.1 AAA family ATPase [Syntrophales bacterium]
MGRPKLIAVTPYQLAFEPIILKELCVDCGISQAKIGQETGLSRPSINLTLNRGYIPKERPDFTAKVEAMIQADRRAMQWLTSRQMKISDIWQPLGKDLRHVSPAADNQKMWATRRHPAMVPGDPERFIPKEVEMISQEAMKYFKIFRNPFIDDIQKDSDIFMSEEHRYIEAAMIDAARHGGFLAVIGEVGSGKSVMRRKVVEQLKKDGDVIVIFPQMIDKTRVNAASICDAIIMDLSEQKPVMKLEAKTRQVHKLLLERAKQGFRAVLIIEEAHDLHTNTLKYLKRFYELEDGYRKLLGIILVGQVELKNLFNETTHIEMREVIRRIQTAEIKGLNGNTKEYLTMKFKRIGAKVVDIFEDSAFDALSRRLTTKDRRNQIISHAYPLIVNNYAARAMNMAYEMGEKKVTEAVVMAI